MQANVAENEGTLPPKAQSVMGHVQVENGKIVEDEQASINWIPRDRHPVCALYILLMEEVLSGSLSWGLVTRLQNVQSNSILQILERL